jgi:hypothetical protein
MLGYHSSYSANNSPMKQNIQTAILNCQVVHVALLINPSIVNLSYKCTA